MDRIDNLNDILEAFKIRANCISYSKIRNVSLYDVKLEPGTRIKEFDKYSNEFMLALKAKVPPLVKAIPDLGVVRLEVVDDKPEVISLIKSIEIEKNSDGIIPAFLGYSIEGTPIWMDIAKNPHLLVAGATGSGKSSLLHTIVANFINKPNNRVFISDSKSIEFESYKKKFSNVEIVNSFNDTNSLLSLLLDIMDYRYNMLVEKQLPSSHFTNKNPISPHLLFIIDEFADLIMQDENKFFYKKILKLAQKCRASGIYCILATQRPSADVISGAIKANFPARISCKVASSVDSKVILDASGAQNLAGQGDAIIKNNQFQSERFQIAYSEPLEIISYFNKNEISKNIYQCI